MVVNLFHVLLVSFLGNKVLLVSFLSPILHNKISSRKEEQDS